LAVYALTLVAMLGLGSLLASLRVGLAEAALWKLERVLPEGNDWFLAHERFSLDHLVLYHDFGDSIRYARTADVLLLGDSKMQFAFPRGVLERVSGETGCSFYNLAFGHAEGAVFARALMEKHDLRPRYAIVSKDDFFRPEASAFAQQVMGTGRWEAWKTVLERNLVGRTRQHSALARLPRWRILDRGPDAFGPDPMIYRSAAWGSWAVRKENVRPRSAQPVPGNRPRSGEISADLLARAVTFQRFLADRGADLVLTQAPFFASDAVAAEALARALGVPFLLPDLPDLVTRDGEHLDDPSAERFATAFLAAFTRMAACPSVR